ncbi:hypothetical protein [Cellulomonas flavigena]|uniref:hypothetical protein n=1 Tax=Cellulomonas flavigena TaxID=1711 RepID=UPI000AC55B6D|nr:hypothetical protein [Cellulomonas flavigena]
MPTPLVPLGKTVSGAREIPGGDAVIRTVSSAAGGGATSGVFASGGSIVAILGIGVASAPGVGVTATAIALDITSFLASVTRLVAHTAAYYDYDSEDPAERRLAGRPLDASS